jgi:hypothetical protein
MGNCCSTISKKKKKNKPEEVYDPEEPNQKMITDDSKKEHSSFDSENVKRALAQDHTVIEEEYDDSSSDESGSHKPQISASRHNKAMERQGSASNMKAFPRFKKPLSAIPQHMLREGFSRQKHNSTSSLYINSTISQPDNDELLKCMATAVLYHIEKGVASLNKTFYDIFNEEKIPIQKSKVDCKKMPDVDTIYKFLSMIFKAERLDSECAIMCLAYIERIIELTGLTMDPTNWRRIVLSALILASKVWEDQSVWNVDFLPVFDNLTAQDLNKLERQFLALLQYNVSLTASLYAKYYFELRTFSKLDSEHFPLQPLDKLNAKRLEDHSLASEYRVKTFKRSASVDQLQPIRVHGAPAVLN